MSWFCFHKWVEKERFKVTKTYPFIGIELKNCILIIQECKKCGKLKRWIYHDKRIINKSN